MIGHAEPPPESEARRKAISEAQALVDAGEVSLLAATFIADALTAEYEADLRNK